MNGFHIQILLGAVGVLAVAGLFLLALASIRYHLTDTHFKITCFGVPVRRLRLEDIRHVGVRPVFWAERWPNCWERGRRLVIRRRNGLLRHVMITPKLPFEFRSRLETACKARLGRPLEETDILPKNEVQGSHSESPRQASGRKAD